eukprot:TRINITY_DN2611_c0_g1_i6.p1 TRINITY_DN2611_c0_g1~~TRINITY_DN2611_c0_g1_i6.p1  ORF type:complete len:142 (-),score=39.26 TRINITY_DN2611_c0_g1_i6:395-820(-)
MSSDADDAFKTLKRRKDPESKQLVRSLDLFLKNRVVACDCLQTHVAEMEVPGYTCFAQSFELVHDFLKFRDGQDGFEESMTKLRNFLRAWPEYVLLPEKLVENDGVLHVVEPHTHHDYGRLYDDCISYLKRVLGLTVDDDI